MGTRHDTMFLFIGRSHYNEIILIKRPDQSSILRMQQCHTARPGTPHSHTLYQGTRQPEGTRGVWYWSMCILTHSERIRSKSLYLENTDRISCNYREYVLKSPCQIPALILWPRLESSHSRVRPTQSLPPSKLG